MGKKEMTQESSIGERITTASITASGLTMPLWVTVLQEWAQLIITIVYFILAVVTLYKQILKPAYSWFKEHIHDDWTKWHRTH